MAVRRTESRIPRGFSLENASMLGQAAISNDQCYALVSTLISPIRLGAARHSVDLEFVVFVDSANKSSVKEYIRGLSLYYIKILTKAFCVNHNPRIKKGCFAV